MLSGDKATLGRRNWTADSTTGKGTDHRHAIKPTDLGWIRRGTLKHVVSAGPGLDPSVRQSTNGRATDAVAGWRQHRKLRSGNPAPATRCSRTPDRSQFGRRCSLRRGWRAAGGSSANRDLGTRQAGAQAWVGTRRWAPANWKSRREACMDRLKVPRWRRRKLEAEEQKMRDQLRAQAAVRRHRPRASRDDAASGHAGRI